MDFLFFTLSLLVETPTPVADDNYNSPGTIGFIITFAVAAIAVLLIFDMNRRVRRTRYRSEIRQRLAEEELGNIELKKPDRPEPPAKPQRGTQE
ncbi:MAG: hypothetical protein VW008_05425 [Aquiluna sp.]